MIYRLATENDITALSEMRWEHEYEEEVKSGISKEDFIQECNLFLVNGLKNRTWVYWIAEENHIIVSNIYVNRIRKVPKPQKLFAVVYYILKSCREKSILGMSNHGLLLCRKNR